MINQKFTKSILIVDDHVDIRDVLKQAFIEKCINEKLMICESGDGLEAQMRISHQKFDVLILDVKLPKKDGAQVLKDLMKQKDKTFKPELIVLISGHFPEEVKKNMNNSALMVLDKPFSATGLVEEIISRWESKKQLSPLKVSA